MKKVIEFLKANNAPAELITEAEALKPVSLENVKDFLQKDEAGKKFLQSEKDAAVTKGIDTFKEKTMPGLIDEKIKEKYPEETEEQKRLRKLEDENKKFQNEVKRERLLNKAKDYASEKKLPTKFIERFLGEDEESTLKNIDSFGEVYSEAVSTAVDAKFKENGREAGGSGGEGGDDKDYSKMSDEEYFKERMAEEKK